MLLTALIVGVKTTKLWKLAIGLQCISRIVLLFYDRKQSETFALLFVKKKIFFFFIPLPRVRKNQHFQIAKDRLDKQPNLTIC